jgi:resuscitation-promoting factor RpfA
MVTVAVTGAGLALPLLGAGAAQAADTGTWDRVAVCESGGLWSADTGNGFYGGLAITQETWDAYGGDTYAERPDLASRSQQIAVAERILSDIGPHAWPGCETGTGLLEDTATPDVNPGGTAAATPAPTDADTDTETDTDTGTGTPTGTATPAPTGTGDGNGNGNGNGNGTGAGTPSTDPTTGTVTATPTPTGPPPTTPAGVTPTDSGVPTDPTDPAPGAPTTGTGGSTGSTATPGSTDPAAPPAASTTPGATDPDTPGAGGRHAKPYDPTDEELAAADQATRTHVYALTERDDSVEANDTGNSGTSPSGAYTVDAGDSLSGIAAARHVDGGWRQLYDANQQVVGDDPNLIKPGQILNLS